MSTYKQMLAQLERDLFVLEMKDHWDVLNFQEAERLKESIEKLKMEIEKHERESL